MSDSLLQFNFLLNIRHAVLAYCFVIKVLKNHHSSGLVGPGFTPGEVRLRVPRELCPVQGVLVGLPCVVHPKVGFPRGFGWPRAQCCYQMVLAVLWVWSPGPGSACLRVCASISHGFRAVGRDF